MAIPTLLTDIRDFLRQKNMKLSSQLDDGRINASYNESELLKEVKANFDVQIPKSRAWYDFAVQTQTAFLPVNIKVTDTTHADNLNCKLGIYYALTGLLLVYFY